LTVYDPSNPEDIEVLNQIREGVPVQFANAAKVSKAKVPTKEAGTEELASSGDEFTAPKIDAELIYKLRHNVYAAGLIKKLTRLVFQTKEKFAIEVYENKPDGTQIKDPKLTAKMMTISERQGVRLWVQMKKSLKSIYYWGIYLSNPVWGQDVASGYNDVQLLKLRHLHSYSFKTSPPGALYTWSELLPGITLDDKGNMEFWQEPKLNMAPEQIKSENIFWVKDRVIFTTPLNQYVLDGITRGRLIDCLKMAGIEVRIENHPLNDLEDAEETPYLLVLPQLLEP